MSWSVSAGGKPAEVAEYIRKQAEQITYLVPAEAAVKDKAIEFAFAGIEANAQAGSISVSAHGSQSSRTDASGETVAVQSVSVSISAYLPE